MKILFTGGGTGGHFYPIIAVAESVRAVAGEMKLLDVKLYYTGPTPYDDHALFENHIDYIHIPAGKIRRYISLANITDAFKTLAGILIALAKLFVLYPDVIFSKGGFASFPTVFAAKILHIPLVIHESDSVPGMVNKWSGKFAMRVALSYEEAAKFFPIQKVAHTGNPVRKTIISGAVSNISRISLLGNLPLILILGGSQGAQLINETLLDALPQLLEKYEVVHQTGEKNIDEVKRTADLVLEKSTHKDRYHPVPYIDPSTLHSMGQSASLIISRAGSTIFEIALWAKPSIIIPITNSNGDHQRENAYNYSSNGAASVIEEANLSSHLLVAEIEKILGDPATANTMSEKAKAFAKTDAAEKIAKVLIEVGMSHEK